MNIIEGYINMDLSPEAEERWKSLYIPFDEFIFQSTINLGFRQPASPVIVGNICELQRPLDAPHERLAKGCSCLEALIAESLEGYRRHGVFAA